MYNTCIKRNCSSCCPADDKFDNSVRGRLATLCTKVRKLEEAEDRIGHSVQFSNKFNPKVGIVSGPVYTVGEVLDYLRGLIDSLEERVEELEPKRSKRATPKKRK